jgi:ATP-dependent Zn protease
MSYAKKLSLGGVAIAVIAALLWFSPGRVNRPPGSTYSQFLQEVRTGKVESVSIAPGNLGASPATYRLKDGKTARTVLPSNYRDALATMQDGAVNINIQESTWWPIANMIPFLLLVAVWLFMMGRLKGRAGVA